MKNVLCVFASFALLAGAASAQAPAPAPAPEPSAAKSPERPALKLQLDEPVRATPRITFGPRDGTPDQRPASMLPELGGRVSPVLEPPVRGDAPGAVYPKDLTPGR